MIKVREQYMARAPRGKLAPLGAAGKLASKRAKPAPATIVESRCADASPCLSSPSETDQHIHYQFACLSLPLPMLVPAPLV